MLTNSMTYLMVFSLFFLYFLERGSESVLKFKPDSLPKIGVKLRCNEDAIIVSVLILTYEEKGKTPRKTFILFA